MTHTLYELDVRLRVIEPPIWRTVEVPGAASLEDVHFALQVAMGWTNSHLHQFVIGDKQYGMVHADDAGDELEDEREFRLEDLVPSGGTFVYQYDFGDDWEHDITVKKVTSGSKPPRPRCVAGARACPPEDCGGYHGYQDLLEALADPKHEEHDSMMEWADGFEPERFELPKKGRDLSAEMETFKELADSDDPFEGFDVDGEPDDLAALDLPPKLIEAVLALEPIQRASLITVIASSLANDLVEVTHAADQLAGALKERIPKKGARAQKRRTPF